MKALIFLSLILAFPFYANCQVTKVSINYKDNLSEVPLIEFHGTLYFSFSGFVETLSIPHIIKKDGSVMEATFNKVKMSVASGDPYVVINNRADNISKTFQLPVSPISLENEI